MTVLQHDELEAIMAELEGWDGDTSSIEKSFRFDKFMDGIAFVSRIAEIAEEKNHHPDIDIRWTTVRVVLSTHSEGGVTEKDIELAKAIDAAAHTR
ncbi:MAG: 4a-hydroxytetrahydrobiopterin dehydratase [Acidimicrobiia bacterium]